MTKDLFVKIIILPLVFLLNNCGSATLKVVSEPEQAEVFIVNKDTKEEISIGQTPLLKKGKELEEQLKGQNSPGGLVNIIVKKDGFKDKDLWVPVNGGGQLGAQLVLKLEPTTSSADELKTAQDLLKKLFLSQQFARSAQLERALIEIDKILEVFPAFDRALSMKAAIYYAKGDFEESLKWYENALAVNPELKTAIDMAGKVRDTLRLPTRVPAKASADEANSATDSKGNTKKANP